MNCLEVVKDFCALCVKLSQKHKSKRTSKPLLKQCKNLDGREDINEENFVFGDGVKLKTFASITLQNKGQVVSIKKIVLGSESVYKRVDLFEDDFLRINIVLRIDDYYDRKPLTSCQVFIDTMEKDEYVLYIDVDDGDNPQLSMESIDSIVYCKRKNMSFFERLHIRYHLWKCGRAFKQSDDINLRYELINYLKYLRVLSMKDMGKILEYLDKYFEDGIKQELKLVFLVSNS